MKKIVVIGMLILVLGLAGACSNENLEKEIEALRQENERVIEVKEYLSEKNKELTKDNENLKHDYNLVMGYKHNTEENALIKEIKEDLDGDGTEDIITLELKGEYYTLHINHLLIKALGDNVEEGFEENLNIVDLDPKDKIKEIAVSESGPSGDPKTAFYRYDYQNIAFMGKIEGHVNHMVFNGKGSLTTSTRGQILHTWRYKDEYRLTLQHVLEHVPKDLYDMGTKVTLKKTLPVKKSRTDETIIKTLEVGEEAVILVTDNERWCLIKAQDGTKGWVEVVGYFSIKIGDESYLGQEIFEGLSFAD